MPARRALIMHSSDNVATVVEEIQAGEEVVATIGKQALAVRAVEKIPFGFKIALVAISQGETIRKYGEAIGKASASIAAGEMVHIHNLEGIRARGDLVERSRE